MRLLGMARGFRDGRVIEYSKQALQRSKDLIAVRY